MVIAVLVDRALRRGLWDLLPEFPDGLIDITDSFTSRYVGSVWWNDSYVLVSRSATRRDPLAEREDYTSRGAAAC